MSLLTEQEIKDLLIPLFIRQDQASIHWPDIFEEVALIESAVIEKIKAQGPAAWAAMSEEGIVEALGFNQSRSRFTTPIYRLPEGD